MQRLRRLASVVCVAVVGLLALGACGRSAPDMAAYVGDHSYSLSYVDEIVDEVKDLAPPEALKEVRRDVIKLLVLHDAVSDYAESHGISVPAADPAAYAQRVGLPPDARFAELLASTNAVVGAVQRSVPPVAPTEADQREAHSHLTVQGNPVKDDFESVRQFFDEKQMGQAVGIRNLLNEIVERADISINPMYGEVTYQVPVQIGQADSWLTVPLGGGSGTVVDAR